MFEDEEDETYTHEQLIKDLNVLIKHGMVDYRIDEDGEWVYAPSEKALRMTEEEQIEFIFGLPEMIEEDN